MPDFYVGIDLGQLQDYTALAVVERIEGEGRIYHVRHLERFRLGTAYPVMAERVAELMHRPPLERRAALVVDATGVGGPVVDLFEAAGLQPIAVTITGGDSASRTGRTCRVPKRDLVSTLQVLLQARRLKIAEALPDAATLVQELMSFRAKITATAHDVYGAWREQAHDDLVLAVALAVWFAEYMRGTGRRVSSMASHSAPRGWRAPTHASSVARVRFWK